MAVSVVEVKLDARTATQNAANFKRQMDGVAKSVQRTDRAAATATANIQRFGVAFRSVLGPVVAVFGAVQLLNKSLNTFGDRQADTALLTNGLEKLGKTAGDLEKLQKAADRLGKQTLFNEDDFRQGFALLTSFKAIGVDSYERVAEAAADIAATTKQDVNSSFLQLAKALEDPVRGMTALSRSGTTFTQDQKELVKQLVESNRALEAQEYILNEVEKQYRGNAAAAGKAGYAGAVDSLGEATADLAEIIGKTLAPALQNILEDITAMVNTFVAGLKRMEQAYADFMRGIRGKTVVELEKQIKDTDTRIEQLQSNLKRSLEVAPETGKVGRAEAERLRGLIQEYRDLRSTLEADIRQITGEELFTPTFKPSSTATDLTLKPGNNSVSKEAKKLTDELARSLQTGEKLFTEFSRQAVLIGETSEIERERLQIQYDYQDRAEQIAELKNVEQQINLSQLNDEIRRLETRELDLKILREQLKIFGKIAGLDFSNTEDLGAKAFGKSDIPSGFDPSLPQLAGPKSAQQQIAEGIGTEIKELRKDLDPIKLATETIVNGAFAIGDAFSTAFGDIITGAKSTQEALADAFASIGQAFISMALEIISKQMTLIILQTIFNALSGMSGGGGGGGTSLDASKVKFNPAAFAPGLQFAEGGYVTGPTNALIGEGGEPEYVIPASKMRGAMARYSSGQRGSSVVNGAATTGGGGSQVIRFESTVINNVEYVTRSQAEAMSRQAAKQGAAGGYAKTMGGLRNSRATRARVGMG